MLFFFFFPTNKLIFMLVFLGPILTAVKFEEVQTDLRDTAGLAPEPRSKARSTARRVVITVLGSGL